MLPNDGKCNEDRAFVKNIIFTDEATLTLNNEPNLQNCRIWARENPRNVLHTRTQYPQKINVWVGLLGHHIIGPFFLQENLTGGRFLQLLQEEIAPAVTEVTREDQEIWFQMDGCPAHNSHSVREFLNESFNYNVIGPNYAINWPARSADLSPNDFFLWGYLKSKVYSGQTFQNLEQLKNCIQTECDNISRYKLANVRRHFQDRLGHCLAVNGDLFEHLM